MRWSELGTLLMYLDVMHVLDHKAIAVGFIASLRAQTLL